MLHLLLVLYALVAYWIDKWYLLRVCRKPVPYSATFVYSTLWWVPWALLVKLAIGVWAFGSMPGTMLTEYLSSLVSTMMEN